MADWITFIGSLFFVILSPVLGSYAHELAHYRVFSIWVDKPEIVFQFKIIAARTDIDSAQDISNRGIRLASIAPFVFYGPLLCFYFYIIGFPKWPLNASLGELVELGYFAILLVAAFPSPSDIIGFTKPNVIREIVETEELETLLDFYRS